MKSLPSSLIFVAVSLIASSAWAQSDLEGKTFEELIGEAKTAYEGENYDVAIKYLLAANRVQPNARLLLNVAKSYEKSNQCVKALVYFRAFVRDPGAEPVLITQAQESLDKADECEGWDESMSGRIMLSASPPEASASVDGTDIGTLPTEVVGYKAGEHTIEITLEGHDPYVETLNLYPDKDVKVRGELTETVEQVVVEEPPPVEPTEPDSSPIVHYAIAGGVGAVGITMFTIGLITDLGIPGKYDEPRQQPGISQAEFDELTEDRKGAVTRAMIFYIVGGVLTAGGAGYGAYVAATSGKKEEAPHLTLTPEFGRDGFGLSLSGRF